MFPSTKAILWDHSPIGSPAQLHLGYYRNPRVKLSEKVLRLVLRHLDNTRESSYTCYLLGSFNIDEDGQGLTLVLDRFDRGHNTANNGLSPSTQTPGDVTVPFQAFKSKAKVKNRKENYASALKCLHHRCISKDAIDLGSFLLTRGSCGLSVVHDVVTCEVEFDLVCPATHFILKQINPVPIVPTALSKNLAGPMSLHHLQGEPKTGYLTMDHTRKLLLVLESDPKAYGLPLIGIWVVGVPFIYSPFVWACCQRYLSNQSIQDRVCEPPEPFLLVLYSPLHSKPEFYECTTNTGKCELDFSLYSTHGSFQLPKFGYSGEVKYKDFDTSLVIDGPKTDPFTAALEMIKPEIPGKSKMERNTDENAFMLSMEDITPRVMPLPQPTQMPVVDTMVPEVSLMFHDNDKSSTNNPRTSYNPLSHRPRTVTSTAVHQTVGPPYSLPVSSVSGDGRTRSVMSRSGSMPNLNKSAPNKGPADPEHFHSSRFSNTQKNQAAGNIHSLTAAQGGPPRGVAGRRLPLPPRPALIPQPYASTRVQQYRQAAQVTHYQHPVNSITPVGVPGQATQPAQYQTQAVRQPVIRPPLVQTRPGSARVPYSSQPMLYPSQDNLAPQGLPYRPVSQSQPPHPQAIPQMYNPNYYGMPLEAPYAEQPNCFPNPAQPWLQLQTRPARVVHFQPAYSDAQPGESYNQSYRQTRPQRPGSGPAHLQTAPNAATFHSNQEAVHSACSIPKQGITPQPVNSQVPVNPSVEHQQLSNGNVKSASDGVEFNLSESNAQPGVPAVDQANLTDNSCRSSQDSGLSVTPDRPTSKGDSQPASPKSPLGQPTSMSLPQLSNIANFNNVPAEVYQLLLHQDSQLKQMQAQIQELLKLQSPKSSSSTSRTTSGSCSVAVNTSVCDSQDINNSLVQGLESTAVQTSPMKMPLSDGVVSPVKSAPDTPPSKSGTTTPSEVRHRGPPQLNSTAKFDSGDVLMSGDLTTVMNNVGLERTNDSIQSEVIVDLPSYHSSPTRSRESRADLSESPIISASMIDQAENGDQVEETSGLEQQMYYNQLMVNIQKLLHNSGEEEEEVTTGDLSYGYGEITEEHQSYSPHSTLSETVTPSKTNCIGTTCDEDKLNSLLRYGTAVANMDTTFIPKINYVSMLLDSDNDTSMEINAMAMKYLKDDQLTQMAKLRAAACVNGKKNWKKAALLQQVLQNGTKTTPNVTQYGMSPNDMTYATKKYMQKYGLLNSTQCDTSQTTPKSEINHSNITRSAQTSGKRPKSAQVVRSDSPFVPRGSSSSQAAPNQHQSELYESYINVISCSVRRTTPVENEGDEFNMTQASSSKFQECRIKESLVQKTLVSKRNNSSKPVSPQVHQSLNTQKQNSAAKELPADPEIVGKSQLEIDTILDLGRLRQLPKLL